MPYSFFEKKCSRIKNLLCLVVLLVSIRITAQVKWDGEAGDGQWSSPANWTGNRIPAENDDVLLDNSTVAGNYTVSLPGGSAAIVIKTITITPVAGNNIQLVLPVVNTAAPALTATGQVYGISIDNGGIFINSSGTAGAAAIVVNDSFRINNGGLYVHNTRSAHAALVTVLSASPGTEKGVFKFDVPGGGYTFASGGRTYGTLIFSAAASGGSQVYASSAAHPLVINGDLLIETGVVINLDLTAATTIKGNYQQDGGVFNLASQSNNNTVFIKGDLIQTSGDITETAAGLPAIELNGNTNQNIQVAGTFTGSVDFRVNNAAGVFLLAGLSLPYNLSLVNGIVHSNGFLTTLKAGCRIKADSINKNSFINGALRKEGLSATGYFLFPVGKDVQRWMALKEVTGNYTVEFFKGNPGTLATTVGKGLHHTSSIEYWSVQADAPPVPAAKVELSFDDVNSGGVTDMAALRVSQLVAGSWTDAGNDGTTGTAGSAGSVVSHPISMFEAGTGYFALASSDAFQNPLPIKLIVFNGELRNDAVRLQWTIANGWQPAYFELQCALDGNIFTGISAINYTPGDNVYQYTTTGKLAGSLYYRLRMIEKDGSFFYSNIIRVDAGTNLPGVLLVQPSIVKFGAYIVVNTATGGNLRLCMYGADGRLMQTMNRWVNKGSNIISLQAGQLAPGVYTLTAITANGKKSTCRFIKVE